MENEFLLKNKTYYQTYMGEEDARHPVQVLGELYMGEQQQERCDLSYIRYAQGEIYFKHHDYETAIFKWENITNELEPWAKKNMADAYFALDLYSNAEELYKSISTDSLCLNTEIALKLLSVYIELNKIPEALLITKKVVALNPDYENVTDIARNVYEQQHEWGNALELAVNELIRTEDLFWYDFINQYVSNGYAKSFEPSYFHHVLVTLSKLDGRKFASFLSVLWKNYTNHKWYLDWMKEVNFIISTFEDDDKEALYVLSRLYETAYNELTSGRFLLKEIEEVVPSLLINWLRISTSINSSLPASAVLAWNKFEPSMVIETIVDDARQVLKEEDSFMIGKKYSTELYEAILSWAERSELEHTATLLGNEQQEEIVEKIRELLTTLSQSRKNVENELLEKITTNEEIVSKLTGAVNQLNDLEQENVDEIIKAFRLVKEKVESKLNKEIPTLLQGCADLINDNSDVRTLQTEINEEANKRVETYIKEEILPAIQLQLTGWIKKSESLLTKSDLFLQELGDSFNNAYGNEQLVLNCDFSIVNDWKRDARRLTSRVQYEKFDIFEKNLTKQFLLKSAGKLLGGLPPKKKLQTAYKNDIANREYHEEVKGIVGYFLLHLGLFESTIQKDVSEFFSTPLNSLHDRMKEIQNDTYDKRNKLNSMRSFPERFDDAFTVFQLRLRQYEWITNKDEYELLN